MDLHPTDPWSAGYNAKGENYIRTGGDETHFKRADKHTGHEKMERKRESGRAKERGVEREREGINGERKEGGKMVGK